MSCSPLYILIILWGFTPYVQSDYFWNYPRDVSAAVASAHSASFGAGGGGGGGSGGNNVGIEDNTIHNEGVNHDDIGATHTGTGASHDGGGISHAGASAQASFDAGTLGQPQPFGVGGVPPIYAGLGFHKNIGVSASKNLNLGLLELLSGAIPGLAGAIPGLGPPVGTPPDGYVPPAPTAGDTAGFVASLEHVITLAKNGYIGIPGFLGPAYIPKTWIGSAFGASGDLWFPVIMIIFSVVGVGFVVHLLLSLVVPLIASKLLFTGGVLAAKKLTGGKLLRSVENDDPIDNRQSIIDSLTQTVMAALAQERCLKFITCQTGNFMRTYAGDKRASQVASIIRSMNTNSEAMNVFQIAAEKGEDCSKYSCWENVANNNKTTTTTATTTKTSTQDNHNHKPLATGLPIEQHTHDPIINFKV